MAQLIAEPTCVTFNSSTILDLVITNCPERFSASGTLSPPSTAITVIFASMNRRSYKRHVWNFNNVNITDLNEELLQLDWFSLCENIMISMESIHVDMVISVQLLRSIFH